MTSQTRRYAVLLKTHFWDGFVRARFDQISRAAPSGDVFVFVDETQGPIAVDEGIAVIRKTVADAERLGLLVLPQSGLFWYNTDYPIYLAATELAGYDYVLMTEYDVALHVDLDAVVQTARARRVDFAAAPIATPIGVWPWTPTLNGVYSVGNKLAHLTCTCLLSRTAWRHLFARRVRLSEQFEAGTLQAGRGPLPAPVAIGVIESWPFAEAFIGTDLALAGFRIAELAEFGSTDGYDWWPPHLASHLDEAVDRGFFHPVLDEVRYIDSLFRLHPDPADWFDPDSAFRGRLEGCDRAEVLRRLNTELGRRRPPEGFSRLRAAVSAEEWLTLGLGFDTRSVPHPVGSSLIGECPQWWAIDLEKVEAVHRIRLFPHTVSMAADVVVQARSEEAGWQEVGRMPPGSAPADIRFDPAMFVRHVRLWSDTGEILRTGRFEIFIDV